MRNSSYSTNGPVMAAIYARSARQQPASIQAQILNCKAVAKAKRWLVLEQFIRSDNGQSGASLDGRDGLKSLILDAKKLPRPFDCILMDDVSRLGRNLSDVLRISDTLHHYGVFLFFASRKIDSRDRSFRQLPIINSMMDESYLAALAEKVHRGKEGRALSGFLPRGRCYGYRNVAIKHRSRRGRHGRPAVLRVRQEIVETQRPVIIRIFESYAEGYSLSRIAKMLDTEGVPCPQHSHKRSAISWCPSAVRDILRNEKYKGVIIWNRTVKARNPETGTNETRRRPESEWKRVRVPELRIISDELWHRVQRQRSLLARK